VGAELLQASLFDAPAMHCHAHRQACPALLPLQLDWSWVDAGVQKLERHLGELLPRVLVVLDYDSRPNGYCYFPHQALKLASRLGRISCLLDPSSSAGRVLKFRRVCVTARRSWWLGPMAVCLLLVILLQVIYIALDHRIA
jgi:hypothetical protein